MPHHLILVTLSGGAGDLEVDSECGHHYKGKDFAGAVSFVPAGCGRQFRMRGVRSEWASISLRPEFLSHHSVENGCETRIEIPTFTNQRDHFILAFIVTSYESVNQQPGASKTAGIHGSSNPD
jgi:AraC family transcriptional regulator